MTDDSVLSYSAAAAYLGVTRQAVYQFLRDAGIEPVPTEVRVGFGKRTVKGVTKRALDAARAQGYLHPRKRKAA